MGETGIDIKLMSADARRLIGLAIECKNTERLNIWEALKQAEDNAEKVGEAPCVVFTRNRSRAYAVVEWDYLLTLLADRATMGLHND